MEPKDGVTVKDFINQLRSDSDEYNLLFHNCQNSAREVVNELSNNKIYALPTPFRPFSIIGETLMVFIEGKPDTENWDSSSFENKAKRITKNIVDIGFSIYSPFAALKRIKYAMKHGPKIIKFAGKVMKGLNIARIPKQKKEE